MSKAEFEGNNFNNSSHPLHNIRYQHDAPDDLSVVSWPHTLYSLRLNPPRVYSRFMIIAWRSTLTLDVVCFRQIEDAGTLTHAPNCSIASSSESIWCRNASVPPLVIFISGRPVYVLC